jgi:hypothetical protein
MGKGAGGPALSLLLLSAFLINSISSSTGSKKANG